MHHDPTFWLLARAAGLTAYALLTLSVLAGLVLKSRPFARLRPAVVTEMHKTLALTGLGALAHARRRARARLDRQGLSGRAGRPRSRLVPPGGGRSGVVAGRLFVLVTGSFWLRKRIGTRIWRRLHWATYALFALATVHGVAAGTDTTRPWAFGLYLSALGAVTAATAWRALARPTRSLTPKGATP